MRNNPRKLLALSGSLLLAVALGACSLIPDQSVGDPLRLDGKQLGMVDLSHMVLDGVEYGDASPAAISPSTNFLVLVDSTGASAFAVASGIVRSHQERQRDANPGQEVYPFLPVDLPIVPPPPLPDHDALAIRVIADYLVSRAGESASSPNVPDPLTGEDIANSQSALERLSKIEEKKRLAEKRRLELEEEANAQRQRRIDELEARRQQIEQQRRNQLELLNRHRAEQQQRSEEEMNWGMPMPFHIPGGEATGVPGFAARIVNSLRQPINISTIEIGVPEDATSVDYPDEIRLGGYALTVTAAERDNKTITSFPGLAQEAMLDEPIVFEHVGNGVYERVGDAPLVILSFTGQQVRQLGAALINGHEVYGNVDMSFMLEPRFNPEALLTFTLEAGDAILRF